LTVKSSAFIHPGHADDFAHGVESSTRDLMQAGALNEGSGAGHFVDHHRQLWRVEIQRAGPGGGIILFTLSLA